MCSRASSKRHGRAGAGEADACPAFAGWKKGRNFWPAFLSIFWLDDPYQKRYNTPMQQPSGKPAMKPLLWVGSSKRDLGAFPGPARREVGYALYLAQLGMRAPRQNRCTALAAQAFWKLC
jgi:hypothetical protein